MKRKKLLNLLRITQGQQQIFLTDKPDDESIALYRTCRDRLVEAVHSKLDQQRFIEETLQPALEAAPGLGLCEWRSEIERKLPSVIDESFAREVRALVEILPTDSGGLTSLKRIDALVLIMIKGGVTLSKLRRLLFGPQPCPATQFAANREGAGNSLCETGFPVAAFKPSTTILRTPILDSKARRDILETVRQHLHAAGREYLTTAEDN